MHNTLHTECLEKSRVLLLFDKRTEELTVDGRGYEIAQRTVQAPESLIVRKTVSVRENNLETMNVWKTVKN